MKKGNLVSLLVNKKACSKKSINATLILILKQIVRFQGVFHIIRSNRQVSNCPLGLRKINCTQYVCENPNFNANAVSKHFY